MSIIVPTYNEEPNVGRLLARVDEALRGVPYELILVDDSSADKTVEVALSAKISGALKIFRKRRRGGKPESLSIGLELAEGTYVTFLDADLEYPPEVLPQRPQQLQTQLDTRLPPRADGRHRLVPPQVYAWS
ncbi:MAG: glycosyltransferase family 2 protein [Thermofilum sp.]